jgi:hypothetical protein
MITETDDVQQALDRLRALEPDARVDFGELVVLGARAKTDELERRRLDDQRRAELREEFLERTRSGDGVDWDVLIQVRESGWSHTDD